MRIISVIDDVHQDASGNIIKGTKSKVIKDEKVSSFDTLEVTKDLPRRLRGLELPHQPGRIGIDHPEVLLAGAVADGCRDEGLPGSSAAGDEDVLSLIDERKIGQPFHEVLVKPPVHGVVNLLHRRRKAKSGRLDQVIDVPVIPLVPFAAYHLVHELVDGHVVPAVVFQACLESVVHPVEFQLLEFLQGIPVHFDFHDVKML